MFQNQYFSGFPTQFTENLPQVQAFSYSPINSFRSQTPHQVNIGTFSPVATKVFVENNNPPEPQNESSLHCKLCDIPLNSLRQAENHYKGQTHLKAQRKFNKSNNTVSTQEAGCVLCGVKFNSSCQAEDHYKGIKHLKKTSGKTSKKPADILVSDSIGSLCEKVEEDLSLNTLGRSRQPFNCSVCGVILNSSAQFDQHCNGHSHKTKMSKKSLEPAVMAGNKSGWYYCSNCNISCPTSQLLLQHSLSAEHKSIAFQKNQTTLLQAS